MTLLIIDSNQKKRAAAAEVLREAGFTIIETQTFDEALRLCAVQKPSLLIIAVREESDSIINFYKQIKSNSSFLNAFILQLLPESLTFADKAVKDSDFVPDASLTEPYNSLNLISMVRTLLKFQQSHQQQTALLNLSHEPIFVWEFDGGIVHWNNGCTGFYGFSIAEALGKISRELLQTRYPISFEEYRRTLSETGKWSGELRHLTKDKREVSIESQQMLTNFNGKIFVLETNRDISERKKAENALLESQLRIKLTTQAAQIGTWQWNLNTNKVFWSAIHQQLWGYEAVDGEVDFEDWRRLLDSEDLQMAENEIEIAKRDGSLYDIEYRIYPADGGAMRWIRSVGQVIHNDSAEQSQMLGISSDITRRKANEDEILRLNRELQQQVGEAELANRSKDEFLAVLSHELRTPLNSMFGWVRMLSSGQLDAKKTRRAIEVIERNIGVQTKLIEDILDVSRIISGKIRLETRQLDFAHLISSVVELTRPTAEAKNVKIVNDFRQDSCTVEGDGERLQQVVGNLLSNAIKFTPSDGTITIKLDCRDNQAEFTVADTGVGIDSEFLPRVFDRFRQADSTSKRRHGGLGLGLAIVKHLIELHGGTVAADSGGEHLGATFTVQIPMQRKKAKAVFTSGNVNGYDNFELDGTSILIVDDDADTLEMMRTMLAAQGAIVIAANSGIEALIIIDGKTPDLLISDIGMPEMDGTEFIRRLRKSSKISATSLPAIALTAYAGVDDRERILKAGFQKYLPKPISLSELLMTIKLLLQKKEV